MFDKEVLIKNFVTFFLVFVVSLFLNGLAIREASSEAFFEETTSSIISGFGHFFKSFENVGPSALSSVIGPKMNSAFFSSLFLAGTVIVILIASSVLYHGLDYFGFFGSNSPENSTESISGYHQLVSDENVQGHE